MEIIISIPETETVETSSTNLNHKNDDTIKPNLDLIDAEYVIQETNIGTGADWIVYLITFSSLFFLGEKIDKNLDAWIKIAKKLKKAFKKLSVIFIDEKAAKLLVK
jgi:hypothetical protein